MSMLVRLAASFMMMAAVSSAATARTLVAILPPDRSVPAETLIAELAQTMTALGPDDRLIVYGAEGPTQLAIIALPQGPNAVNPAWVKRKLAEAFRPVMTYLKGASDIPATGGIAGNLMIPAALDAIGRNLLPALPEREADILLLGSWQYLDRRDGRWAIIDRFYPSDAHIRAARAETPFGTAGAEERLRGGTLHFCWPGGDAAFETDAYREAVTRFWTLYVTAQAGRIGTFSQDMSTCFQRWRAGEATGQAAYAPIAGGKIEMLRAPGPVAAFVPDTMDQPGEYFLRDDVPISRTPPTAMKGIAWIGLKWNAPCDVDLYSRPDGSSQWLYYGQVRSADGRFNKDFLSATGETQFEYIEFVRPIDLATAEVAINLYSGELAVPPEGVIRVWFGGRVYEAPFKLAAKRGNRGALPMTGANWLRIDLRKVLGLSAPDG